MALKMDDEHNLGSRWTGVVRRTVRFGLADQIEFLNLVRPPSCLACVVLAKRGRKEEEERRKKEEEGKEDGGIAIQRTKLSSASSLCPWEREKKNCISVDLSALAFSKGRFSAQSTVRSLYEGRSLNQSHSLILALHRCTGHRPWTAGGVERQRGLGAAKREKKKSRVDARLGKFWNVCQSHSLWAVMPSRQ